jgi:hypothetical protein
LAWCYGQIEQDLHAHLTIDQTHVIPRVVVVCSEDEIFQLNKALAHWY